MKIAISTDQGYVSAHFGRCPSYTIIEIKEGQIQNREEISNPGHQPGFLPQYLSERGVSCIVAGGMGPRAQSLFSQKNIEFIIGVQGSVDEIIQKLVNQELEPGEDLCDHGQGVGDSSSEHPLGAHEYGEESTHPKKAIPSELKGGKIAFTSSGTDLNADLDPRFGRTQYFLIYDPETSGIEAVENPNKDAVQGAGVQTAQLILKKDIRTIVTGQVGPNARSILESGHVHVVEGAEGKVGDILKKLKREEG
jgi:predicted Fe-Mo cluster-binding NifX family protein